MIKDVLMGLGQKSTRLLGEIKSEELDKVYLVPVEEVGTTRAHLWIEPSKNGQEKNVRWAKDYEL